MPVQGPQIKRTDPPTTGPAREVYRRRIEHRLTQAEVARLLGVTQPVVSAWECGLWAPSPARLAQLRELLP